MTSLGSLTPGGRLRALLRRDEVLCVLGVPTARYGRIMDSFGVEAGFVGTSITYGNYTGLPDTGVASAPECVAIGGHVSRAVSFPCLLDGDTGHGGRGAVRRLVADAIREGLAGLRLDDQPLQSKQRTQSEGILVADREAAIERYAWAVEARNEIDPTFVIMAQCYARDAINGGLEETLDRLVAYHVEGGADWVQFESPHSIDELRAARTKVTAILSAMKGKLPKPLSLEEHRALGLDAAWYTFLPSRVLMADCVEFMREFTHRGVQAWIDFEDTHRDDLALEKDWL